MDSSINQHSEFHDAAFLNILSEKSIKIDKKFIIKITRENRKSISREAKRNCKILKLSFELNFKEVLETLDSLKCKEYPNLFILVIETKNFESETEKQSKSIARRNVVEILNKFDKDRPLILQMKSKNKNLKEVFYREENSEEFCRVEWFGEKVGKFLNFPTFLCSILDGLVESSVDIVIENFSTMQNSSLTLRFLRVLDIPEKYLNKLILKCAAHGSKNDLLSALDVAFEDNGIMVNIEAQKYLADVINEEESTFTEDQNPTNQQLAVNEPGAVSSNGHSNSSVLYIAVENANLEVIDYLVNRCTYLIQKLPINHQIMVSTSAFETNNLDVLCDLLKISDFPFPKNFKVDLIDHKILKDIIAERTRLESAIKVENFEEISKFIDENLSLKIAYNTANKSALQQSVDLKNYKIYYYLKTFGFKTTEFTNLENILSPDEIKVAIKCRIQQRRKNVSEALCCSQNSVNLLCNRSLIHNRKISKEQEAEYRMKIRKWFEDINKFETGADLLKVAALCGDLKIIFDFENNTTENVSLSDPGALGSMYPSNKWIFVGSKLSDKKRDQEIKGVLAHELCHYAMKLVYENKENPYYKHLEKIIDEFGAIVEAIDLWSSEDSERPDDGCNGIISTVFQFYDYIDFHPELIVRVVQILAAFDDNEEESRRLQERYKQLFDYWESYVKPELKKFNLKCRENVRKMNRTFELLDEIISHELEFVEPKNINALLKKNLVIITTNVPKLLLSDIFNYLRSQSGDVFDTKNIFVDPQKLKNSEIFNNFKKLVEENSGLNVFVDCSKEFCEKLNEITLNAESSLFYVVSDKRECDSFKQIISVDESRVVEMEINYSWSDLIAESQISLLERKIIFQEDHQHITFCDILEKEESSEKAAESVEKILNDFSEIVDDHLLNSLVEEQPISINTKLKSEQAEENFEFLFQSREFISNKTLSQFSHHEFISKVRNDKYVLISDIAGTGKSWVMRNSAYVLLKQNPPRWVTFVDLKQFITEYKTQKDVSEFSTFVADKIFKLNINYEKKLFKKLYEIGKVCILLDGFDEIAPDYAKFFLKWAQSFKSNGGNQLWIATRDYFKVNLQKELQIDDSFKLSEFKEENGTEFIVKSWLLNDTDTSTITSKDDFHNRIKSSPEFEINKEIARKIIKKTSVSRYNRIGMPQIYKIIADISTSDKEATTELTETKIYRTLVQKLYERWSSAKGDIRKEANTKSQEYDLNFWKFHQFMAIKSYFPKLVESLFPQYDEGEWSDEEIVACGLMSKRDEKFYFLHETFREFFAADFVSKMLRKTAANEKVLEIFVEVMTVEKYGIIRMFLYDEINCSLLDKLQSKMKKYIGKFQEMESFADIFIQNLDNLEDFVIDVLKTGEKEKFSQVLTKSAGNIFRNTKNPEKFSRFHQLLFDNCHEADLKRLITEERAFLYLIQSSLDAEYFEEFITKIRSKFFEDFVKVAMKRDIRRRENIFTYLCESSNFNFLKFKKFLAILKTFFTSEEIFEMMWYCNGDGATILQVILERAKNPLTLWDEVRNFLVDSPDLFVKLVMKKDYFQHNILPYSVNIDVESYEIFWDKMFELFDLEVMKDMIIEQNRNKSSFIHEHVQDDSVAKIEYTVKIFEEKFSDAQLEEIFKSQDGNGDNPLQIAVYFLLPNQTYKILFQAFRNVCNTEKEFLKILTETVGWNAGNILHVVAANNDDDNSSSEVLEFMIEELEGFEPCDEIRKLLSHRDDQNHILLTLVVRKKKPMEVYEKLWKLYRKCFDLRGFLKIEGSLECSGDNSFLYHVVGYNTREFVELTWKEITSLRNQDELQLAHFLRTENWQSNLLEVSLKNHQEVHEWVKNILHKYGILLELEVFPEFDAVLQNCIQSENVEILKLLLTEVEEFFSSQNLSKNFRPFLMLPNSTGNNILHRVSLCHRLEFHKALWGYLLKVFDDRESLKICVIELNSWRCNFVHHLLIGNKVSEIIQFTLNIFEENFNEAQLREILKSKSWNGRSLLQTAVIELADVKIHKILWKIIRKSFKNEEEIISIFKDVDDNGDTILHLTSLLSTNKVFKLMIKELEKVASNDKIKEILSTLNRNEQNLLHVAAWNNRSLNLHVALWKTFIRYFHTSEILEFVKHVNAFGDDLLHFAVHHNKKEVVELTWNMIKCLLNRDEQAEYLRTKLKKLLMRALNNRQHPNVQEWMQNIIVHYSDILVAVKIKNEKVINFIQNSLRLMGENGNIFYYLCKSTALDTLDILKYLTTLQKFLTTEDIIKLMKNCSHSRKMKNIFHVCIWNENGPNLIKLWMAIRSFFEYQGIVEIFPFLLLQTNSNHDNFLDLSVFSEKFDLHKIIWELLLNSFEKQSILNNLILRIDRNGENFVHKLVQQNKNPLIIEHIFNIFKTSFNEIQFQEILK